MSGSLGPRALESAYEPGGATGGTGTANG